MMKKMRKADISAANVSAGLSTEAFMWAKMYRKDDISAKFENGTPDADCS